MGGKPRLRKPQYKLTTSMYALKRNETPKAFESWFYCGEMRWYPTLFDTHYTANMRRLDIGGEKYRVVRTRVIIEEIGGQP